ncbi:hypothetical protein [Spirosoma lacussanchae]|uniref:hypothetical protein n=1 Tax=Spirosoma lacussanchae TaxID=1884249 RepID=UPI001107EA1F|nr:hypothetical protein [Spirosoma lacussanchae]
MKRTLFFTTLLGVAVLGAASAQSNQSPTMQQSTSTEETRPANPVRPKIQRRTRQERMQMETGLDTTLPKNRKQRRLRPDSLRRGGATRVDTIR